MRSFFALTVAAVAAATLTAASASTYEAAQHQDPARPFAVGPTGTVAVVSKAVAAKPWRARVVRQIHRTWYWQDRGRFPRTRSNHSERRTVSIAYLRWDARRWHHRARLARKRSRSRLPSTGDWMTAVRIVQRTFPGTEGWMLKCSGAESSHGAWVWNGPNGGIPYDQGGPIGSGYGGYRSPPAVSSGAGGWMQFMEGTWSGMFYMAVAYARLHHLPVPLRADWSWIRPVGHAFAAGWGYFHGRSAWTGDPACA